MNSIINPDEEESNNSESGSTNGFDPKNPGLVPDMDQMKLFGQGKWY